MTSIQNTNRHTCHHCEMEVIRMEDSTPTLSAGLHWKHGDPRVYPTFLLPLKHNPRDVRAAADSGCPFFVVLWENLRKYCRIHDMERWIESMAREKLCFEFQAIELEQTSISDSKTTDDTSLLPASDSRSRKVYDIIGCRVISEGPGDVQRWNHDFIAVSDWDDPSANHAIARSIDGPTSSSQAIGQIRRRLQYCLAHHDNCKATSNNIRPRRFISVSDSDDDKVKIVQAQNLASNGDADPYAALSYCWGHDQVFKLTSANKTDAENGIPLNLVPKTITDAIRVTRELGIKLLWVDSLCLVQDEENELAKEIAKMHHYYGNAHFTISAATAASCSDGFLQDEPLPRESGTRPIDGPFRLPVDLGFQEGPSYLKFIREQCIYEPQVIDSRAWTLQEGLLSQRLVSFGSRFIRWFCRTDSYGIGKGTENLQQKLADVCSPPIILPDRKPAVKTLLVWWEIVEDYSLRSMTNSKDKLLAISGIASVISESSADAQEHESQLGFMAGFLVYYTLAHHPPSLVDRSEPVIRYHPQNHFESWLIVIQMLWLTYGRENQETLGSAGQTQSSPYIAPSWSWASRVEEVSGLADTSLKTCVEDISDHFSGMSPDLLSTPAWEQGLRVHEVCVAPINSETPLGALAGGSLTMEGYVFRPDQEQDAIHRIFFDDGREEIAPGDCRGLYCLRLVPVYTHPKLDYPHEGLHGIVLEPVDFEDQSRSEERVYRRVGIYKIKTTEKVLGMIEKIKII